MRRRATIVLFLCLGAGGTARAVSPAGGGDASRALPAHEVEILCEVGREYGLDDERVRLLLAIRKVENGGPGVEMGVASDLPRHASHRMAGDPGRSLRLQARWAAGTIRKRYQGNLESFAKGYCPPNSAHWASMVRYWMGGG